MSRVLAIVDGEHYPPVVREALALLAETHVVVGACFVGGTEKIDESALDYGVPVTVGPDACSALDAAMERHAPDLVIDLSDEPVLTSSDRFRLASVALRRGVTYLGADFQFDPVAVEAETATPTLAIVGTGKRVGKTAVCAYAARLFATSGITPVVLAMGRGGPARPEIVRGDLVAIGTRELLELARSGAHASSDCYEDAATSRVATVGCRRCGGGMAGSVFYSNVAEGAAIADELGADLILLEGSGASVPPVYADASLLVVGASRGAGYLTDFFGPLRLATADAVVIAGAEPSIASPEEVERLLALVRGARPDVPACAVTFRPRPLAPISGARVLLATTAPAALAPVLARHLEETCGCSVVAVTPHLSDRPRLRLDLDAARGTFDVIVTEIKAAAIDVVAEYADAAGVACVLCDNEPVAVAGDDLDTALLALAQRARARGGERSSDAG